MSGVLWFGWGGVGGRATEPHVPCTVYMNLPCCSSPLLNNSFNNSSTRRGQLSVAATLLELLHH